MKCIKYIFFIVFFPFLNNSSAQLIHDFKVNDDTAGNIFRYHANISTNKNGLSAIVWQEYIQGNIYAQIYDKNFLKINNNFKVNAGIDSCSYQDIIVTNNDKIGIVWQKVNGVALYKSGTYFKLFNNVGNPLTPAIRLNDTLKSYSGYPRIGVDSNSRYIIVWEYTQWDVYFQILDSIGNKIGTNKKANEGNTSHGNPDILVRKDGSFIIVWEDRRSTIMNDIYMQMFDRNGNPIGSNQRVNDDTVSSNSQYAPKISGDSSGNFTISFNEYILNYNWSYIRFQRYDKNGVKLGLNKTLPPTADEMFLTSLDSDEDGNLIFQTNRNNASNYYVYNIRVDKNDNPIGYYFPVSNEFIYAEKYGEDIKLFNKKIINVWIDYRLTPQPQIYANVRSYSNPDSTVGIINISNELPSKIKLFQNYPNPFNPLTNIKYQLPKDSKVSLVVYDILGREMIKLVNNEFKKAGSYTLEFNGQFLASGVYFYRIIADSPGQNKFIKVKKMVMIK